MKPGFLLCLMLPCLAVAGSTSTLSVSEIQERGKVLFRALRDSECKIKCKSRKTRIMCGSDGVSYLSKCEIKRARRCEGKNVTIKKKGKCSDSDVPMTKCFQEREEARNSGGRSNSKEVFIPSCTSDGNFAEVQCHKASGYCWCVSKEGKPFPGTSSKNKKPNCRGGTPSPSKVVSRIRRRKGKRKRRVGCSSLERTKFNSNLVRVFTEEYDRSIRIFPTVAPNRLDPVMDTLDKKVVEWKFSEFDKDTDNRLSRKEVKSLRRLVKKFIKPRACAKSFLKYCDSNHDKFIERREWSLCLGVDINKDQTTDVPGPGRKENPSGDSINRLPKLLNPKSSSSSNRESHDCKSEESSALEQEAENPDGGIFIPRCTVDGKWQRAQCHKSTGYCWCVNENTGHPIGGTSTHGVAPECNFEAERDIQGCEYSEKQAFLFDLMTTMTTELAEFAVNNNNNNTHTSISHFSILPSPEPSQSIHERAVRWKFNMLDENTNNLLEKEESSNLKTTLKNSRKKWTRKCSRNFIKYCDENSDKQISLDEWVDCTGINRSLPTHPKRTGKNPFDHFLRDT